MDIPIKTAEWMQDGDFMLIQNGTDVGLKGDGFLFIGMAQSLR